MKASHMPMVSGLSKWEEGEMLKLFGDEYADYVKRTPMFIPSLRRDGA